jgi:hypothetical protein
VCKKHQKATIFFLNSNSSLKRTHINHQSIIGTSKEEQEERREERFRALVEENDSRANNDFVIMVSVTTFFFSLLHFGVVTRIFKGNSFSPRVPLFRVFFLSATTSSLSVSLSDDSCSLFFFLRGVFVAFPRDDAKKYIRRLLRVRIRVQSRRTRSRWRLRRRRKEEEA